ncbi:zinc ribbon domain-containing protein [Ruminococcus bromii]|uniref:Putative membrane protein n=1 Tax=Ruminococcus bromii TaxID=40518 RepID=A0A2N0UXV8_9FIRM|nr:zinc ribbon domain-containing protein [Ruminococcus bromii]PKD31789.1 putative membrane protein [Ruminococcus bromii]
MFCKNCGRQLLPNEKFCADCGTPVSEQESAVQNEQPIAENQSVEQTADMNVRNEQTQPVEVQQTDAFNNQTAANDYAAPQYQTVNAQGGYNQYQNGQQGGYSYDYNNQGVQPQYAQPIPKKKSKTPFIITACGVAVALVIAIAVFFIFTNLNKATPQGQIQGTWVAEEDGVRIQLEFKPDGTINIPNAKELGKLISSYAGSSDYSDFINYDEIFNMIKLTYSIDDQKTLSVNFEVSFINQSQSQSLKWSDDPANGGSDTWGIDGDNLYIAGTKLTRVNS